MRVALSNRSDGLAAHNKGRAIPNAYPAIVLWSPDSTDRVLVIEPIGVGITRK
jgi:hypothetical protein